MTIRLFESCHHVMSQCQAIYRDGLLHGCAHVFAEEAPQLHGSMPLGTHHLQTQQNPIVDSRLGEPFKGHMLEPYCPFSMQSLHVTWGAP